MSHLKHFTLSSRANSLGYAIAGLRQLLRQEPNMIIHAVATILVVTAGLIRGLSSLEWIAIIATIAMVWITEAINTTIEMLCNLVCDNKYDPLVKRIKDISAGAVLIAALASVITASFIFFK